MCVLGIALIRIRGHLLCTSRKKHNIRTPLRWTSLSAEKRYFCSSKREKEKEKKNRALYMEIDGMQLVPVHVSTMNRVYEYNHSNVVAPRTKWKDRRKYFYIFHIYNRLSIARWRKPRTNQRVVFHIANLIDVIPRRPAAQISFPWKILLADITFFILAV